MQRLTRDRVRAIATVERMSHTPPMRCHAFVLAAVVSSFSGAVHAQTWSVTASAPTPGKAWSSVNSSFAPIVTTTATLPIGPVAPGIFFANIASVSGAGGSGYGSSSIEWSPAIPATMGASVDAIAAPEAPLAFRVFTASHGVSNTSRSNYVVPRTHIEATVRVLLRAPQPTAGRLVVRHRGVECDFGDAQIDVDIDADGTIEISCMSPYSCSEPWQLTDMPFAIPDAGRILELKIRSRCGVNPGLGGHGANETVEVRYFPGHAVLRTSSSVGATASLLAEHRVDNTVHLWPYHNWLVPGSLIVFGVQPMTVPITPTLTQLVSIDTWAFAPFTALMPPLPPGSVLYCQGLVIDTTGTLRGTRSLRALWP